MRRTAIIALFAASLVPLPAAAQSEVYADLQAIYSLWGFMDTVGKVCAELNGNDVVYLQAVADWRSRNAAIRDQVDNFLMASGEDRSLVAAAEETARQGIEPGLREAPTPAVPCATWLDNLRKGSYEPELYVEAQLARLRSPDGD